MRHKAVSRPSASSGQVGAGDAEEIGRNALHDNLEDRVCISKRRGVLADGRSLKGDGFSLSHLVAKS